MLSKAFAGLCLAQAVVADDTEPSIQLALAPAASPQVSSVLAHLSARRANVQASAMAEIDAAMKTALDDAKSEIQSLFKTSFLKSEVLVKVASTPSMGNEMLQKIEHFATYRDDAEAERLNAAKVEFASIAKVVLGEVRKALGKGSFLGEDALNLKVKASAIPFLSAADLASASEVSRNADEESFHKALLEKQISFVKALHGMVAAALK